MAGLALSKGEPLPVIYLDFRASYEWLLEMLLAFGTVILVMEDVRREAESANAELRAATERLEHLARTDPLTESLNRHAFYSLVESDRDSELVPTGCVCLLDIDNLKPLNDTLGHSAGDDAIRAVSKAIRSVVRPDDLVFRWGGDEFLAVLYGVTEAETRGRLNRCQRVPQGDARARRRRPDRHLRFLRGRRFLRGAAARAGDQVCGRQAPGRQAGARGTARLGLSCRLSEVRRATSR